MQVSISLLIAALAPTVSTPNALQSLTIEPYATSVTRAIARTKSGLDLAVRDTA